MQKKRANSVTSHDPSKFVLFHDKQVSQDISHIQKKYVNREIRSFPTKILVSVFRFSLRTGPLLSKA